MNLVGSKLTFRFKIHFLRYAYFTSDFIVIVESFYLVQIVHQNLDLSLRI